MDKDTIIKKNCKWKMKDRGDWPIIMEVGLWISY